MLEKKVNKSENIFQLVGELLEINIAIIDREKVELRNWNTQSTKTVNCQVATRKEFKNPTMLIGCENENGATQVELNLNDVNEFILDDSGDVKENPDFKARKTILETYKCKTVDTAGTRVDVNYSVLKPNEYVNKDYEYKIYKPNITAYNISSANVPQDDIFEGKLTGVISRIVRETKGEDGDETGRLKVQMYVFEKDNKCFPVDLVVDKDLADDFEDTYSVNDNASISYECVKRQVGGRIQSSDGRKGRRQSRVASGYTVVELSIFDFAEEPIDEENKYYVSAKQMKAALKERDMLIESKIQKAKTKQTSKTGFGTTVESTKAQEQNVETVDINNPFTEIEDDDDDLPF